ncbi:MAG: recombinase family protein [bacterium]|nr:recombinase family protein [bacterium]
MKYQAALYIRLSREDENEGPSESIANQRSLLDAYVQQNGISVYDTYVDDTAIMGLNQNPVQTGVDLVPFFFLSALFSANEGVPA